MKFYLAFSIHGTKKFFVFTRNAADLQALGKEFSQMGSRRPDYNANADGYKVHWTGLNTKDGQPLRSASWAHRRMRKLLTLGWTQVAGPQLVA